MEGVDKQVDKVIDMVNKMFIFQKEDARVVLTVIMKSFLCQKVEM